MVCNLYCALLLIYAPKCPQFLPHECPPVIKALRYFGHLLVILLVTGTLPGADFPSQVILANGKVIHNTSFGGWRPPGSVIIKHPGGADPIQLRYIAKPSRVAIEAYHASEVPEPLVAATHRPPIPKVRPSPSAVSSTPKASTSPTYLRVSM